MPEGGNLVASLLKSACIWYWVIEREVSQHSLLRAGNQVRNFRD